MPNILPLVHIQLLHKALALYLKAFELGFEAEVIVSEGRILFSKLHLHPLMLAL